MKIGRVKTTINRQLTESENMRLLKCVPDRKEIWELDKLSKLSNELGHAVRYNHN
jgi:hypothetical protein